MTYKVHKGLTGKRWVSYACEHCQSLLESPIDEAGTTQNCPTCGSKLLVPGQAERKAIEQERRRMIAEQARIVAERERQQTALDQHVAAAMHEESSSQHVTSGNPETVNVAAGTQTEDDISYRWSVQREAEGISRRVAEDSRAGAAGKSARLWASVFRVLGAVNLVVVVVSAATIIILAINPSHDESERTASATALQAASQALGAAFFGMIACFAVAAVLSVGAAVVALLRRIADGK